MEDLMTVDNIRNKVYMIRGQQVMLDSDLAELYGYEVKKLNQQVKRNIERFPEDFMFQLKKEEIPEHFLKSQIVTLKNASDRRGMHIKKMPFAFTEQGIYMLATVLRGELAEQQSIFIMRAFREMRHIIRQNQQFILNSEQNLMGLKLAELSIDMSDVKQWRKKTDESIENMQNSIESISENFISEEDFKDFVIYKNQKFEADVAYIDIYQRATKSIYVIDDYMNAKSLQLISQKKQGVEVILFTENAHGRKGFLTKSVVEDFSNQYPLLRIKPNSDSHDRWIIIDYGLPTEEAYHCGASSKDAGQKVCAISRIENSSLVHPVVEKLLLGADAVI